MQRTLTRTPQRVTPILDREDSRSEYEANEQLLRSAQRHMLTDDPRDYCEDFDYRLGIDWA